MIVRDFRRSGYDRVRIERCGRHVATHLYWKLYAIENTIRLVIHSVLTGQLGSNWWMQAVRPKVMQKAVTRRNGYAAKPQHADPGTHDIYLIDWFDLVEILRANSNLFLPVVTDIQQWIADLEGVRLSRNLVGHMNFPNAYDRGGINRAYQRLPVLLSQLQASNVPVLIP